MASEWSCEATQALLGIWGEQNVQSQLDGVARNRNIYEKLQKVCQCWDMSIPGSSVGPK